MRQQHPRRMASIATDAERAGRRAPCCAARVLLGLGAIARLLRRHRGRFQAAGTSAP